MIRWDPPGPYRVVFTTRNGGVSEGPYASLNLGRRTGDDVDRVDENRRRACAEIGADAGRLALNYQVHGVTVNRAEAGLRGTLGDALWTDEPGVPMLALTADCVPVALVRTDGEPAAAVVHAGRIGVLAGALHAAVRTLGGRIAAAIGPAAGPCCYEVGPEVHAAFGTEGRTVDLKALARARLEAAGVDEVHDCRLCTICDPERFFSHRRDDGVTGRQAGVAWRS